MAVTIYHNPRCSKSRQTLALIEESGIPHKIVQYLDDTPDAETLLSLAGKLGVSLSDLLRRGESEFKDATDLPDLTNDQNLAAWLFEHPIVLERPIIVDDDSGQAVVGRPPENVLHLLSR